MFTGKQMKDRLATMTDKELEGVCFTDWHEVGEVDSELSHMDFGELDEEQELRHELISDEDKSLILARAIVAYESRSDESEGLDVFIRQVLEDYVMNGME